MKKMTIKKLITGLMAAILTAGASLAAAFTAGNIVVMRNGYGTAPLTSAGTAGVLVEYTPSGSLVQTIALPTTFGSGSTPNPLVDSGVASSDGMITRSTDKQYLIVPGYATNLGVASVASGAGIARCVGVVKYDGSVDTTTTFADGLTGNNFRSAVSTDGSDLWMIGNGGTGNKGARYTTKGSSTSVNIDATPNARCGGIYGGNLYYNSQTVMYKQTGTPTIPTSSATITFSGTAPASMYQFVYLTVSGNDVCYIADDSKGGILKYSVSGTTFTYQGMITAAAVRGLTGYTTSSNVTLFATTGGTTSAGGGTIWTVTDTAAFNAAPSTTTPTLIATADSQTAFRGIALAPETLVAAPAVAITTPATGTLTVPNATLSYDLAGTSADAVGDLTWSNALTSASGTVAAGATWAVSNIALNLGANLITVSGTNTSGTAGSATVTITRDTYRSDIVNFIYTSDNHYGIVRPIFRGSFNVPGQTVNEAMIDKMNSLPGQTFPNDGGVGAGQSVGHIDFLVDTGDFANRSESQSAIPANTNLSYLGGTVNYPGYSSYTCPPSAVTWAQYQHDFLGDTNTGNRANGRLMLQDSMGLGIPVYLSPGNHDISDAIGMVGKISASNVDATSFCQIYNRMTPYSGKAPITTNVFANPGDYTNVNLQVNYSFDVGGTHVQVVNMFPDRNVLKWMTADLAGVSATTPVFLFCHAPVNMAAGETKVFGTPTATSSSAAADIPFPLNGVDSATSYKDMNSAKQCVADWLMAHPNVKALFSGHDNFNGATIWNGQDANGSLIDVRDSTWAGVTLFRVDSPMKGDISGTSATGALAGIGSETNLSFQVYSLDPATHRLTEREYLWNNTADTNGGAWSVQTTTIDLSVTPVAPVTLVGPANGTVVSNGYTTLAWSPVVGASGYTVALTQGSNTSYYNVVGTSLPLSFPLANGAYTWSVTAYNGSSVWPVSASGSFTMNLPLSSTKWSFGVMDDTQWTCATDPAGQNTNHISVSIINQINPQFINAGVKFVVQVGDLTENGNNADIQTRAAAAQPLLDAGIGFFPMRGNHETYASPANSYGIPQVQASFPQTRGLTNTFGAANFSSPTFVSSELDGMSYTFDYGAANNNARFLVIDNWVTPTKNVAPGNGYNYGYSIADQQAWISGRLDKNSRGAAHAFVFSHQPLMAENHQDSPFVGSTATNPAMQNAFYASLQTNNVKYYISGHDHIHQRSLIASPDGLSSVEEIIGASDSSKFYTPKATNDAGWAGQKYRETSLAQERYTVGYYIYTVDGPRLTVDYYSDDHGNWLSDNSYPAATGSGLTNQISPTFNFVKKETFGYSLNGQRFLVPQGGSYTSVADSIAAGMSCGETYKGTTASILAGINGSTNKDYTGRSFIREINTGWTPATNMAGDVLTLWGMADLGATRTDTYVLSMSYDPAATTQSAIQAGLFGLLKRNTSSGNWVNAADLNAGGVANFVMGPWNSSYTLGTCGVDTNTHTAWAVINQAGDFAVGALPHKAGYNDTSWKFGVMSDTQWTGVPADQINNPNNVAVSIINQINPQFINAGVQFVVQVGDLTENGAVADVDVRAAAATNLYNAGIGFFPLRGNHESSQLAGRQVTNDFPQMQGLGANVKSAVNFSSPTNTLQGLSYAFDYNNTRMVLLDQFVRLDGSATDVNSAMVDQVPWIGATLSNRTAGTHAFVFTHKNLIGENHVDCLFGANPSANTNAQNQFISALQNTGVRYTMSGHDHVYQRSMIASPDALSSVEEIICGSDSSKFYTPTNLANFAGQKPRETSLVQDLYRVTYYLATVDGPRCTMDYYASDETYPSGNSPAVTPALHFNKRETFGYSLNGQRFLVAQSGSYTTVVDSVAGGVAYSELYKGTTARILAGVNGSTAKDYNNRNFIREINTGWAPAPLASDALTLWGMADLATNRTDTYVLSMSYDPTATSLSAIQSGTFGLLTRAALSSAWVNAADLNAGGTPNFVLGPWNSSYTLGTCGVDTNTATAWAVVNHGGDFAVGPLSHPITYTLTATAGANGTVTPATAQVAYGFSTNFEIQAASYYHITDVLTNGVSVGGTFGMSSLSYAWNNILADGTLAVAFAQNLTTNGTPEAWLEQYGLTNGVPGGYDAAAQADTDGDGLPNWAEYVAGTDPTNPDSVLKVAGTGVSSASEFGLQWPSVAGRVYDVESSTNLSDTVPFQPLLSGIQATPSTNSCTVPVSLTGPHFFRVKVRLAP